MKSIKLFFLIGFILISCSGDIEKSFDTIDHNIYIVSFKDMESRDESWDNFINDPEWIRVFEESIIDGPIVREIEQVFLSPTIFSNLN